MGGGVGVQDDHVDAMGKHVLHFQACVITDLVN